MLNLHFPHCQNTCMTRQSWSTVALMGHLRWEAGTVLTVRNASLWSQVTLWPGFLHTWWRGNQLQSWGNFAKYGKIRTGYSLWERTHKYTERKKDCLLRKTGRQHHAHTLYRYYCKDHSSMTAYCIALPNLRYISRSLNINREPMILSLCKQMNHWWMVEKYT